MLATTLSALYGKLLVVMGIAFPMAEVISTYIPPSFYEVSVVYIPGVFFSLSLSFHVYSHSRRLAVPFYIAIGGDMAISILSYI